MEIGKWIVFAFLAGAVLVGFRTRTLKGYEFVVSGLFMLLLDGLVFGGDISRWVGEVGKNVKGAADNASLSPVAGMALAASPGALRTARRFGRRLWQHRPTPLDYTGLVASVIIGYLGLNMPLPLAAGVFTAVLAVMVVLAAVCDSGDTDRDADPEGQDGREVRAGG